MRYIESYKIFEASLDTGDFDWDKLTREQKKGKLLHLYSSIPIQKEKAQKVIKSIVRSSGSKFSLYSNLIKPWNTKDGNRTHDKLRFSDYFDSLLSSKDTRGFNFEGLIAGLFDGKIQPPGSRSDVILKTGERCSIKFLDDKTESPVLGSIKKSLSDRQDILDTIGTRRIYDIFKSKSPIDIKLGDEIYDLSFSDVDLFLIAYPEDSNIKMHVIKSSEIKEFLSNGLVAAPKSTPGQWQLRLSSRYRHHNRPLTIRVPFISNDELDGLWDGSKRDWSKKIFGPSISKRLRTDVIDDIISDKENIIDRLNKDS